LELRVSCDFVDAVLGLPVVVHSHMLNIAPAEHRSGFKRPADGQG
jgi:hypothetical protein